MFRFAIEKPVILTVVILITCLFGILAIFRVPIQMIPDLDVRTISVITSWPGASPQDVEKEIIIEQEEYLRRIPSLDRMISRATTGSAEIELEFSSGTDINEVLIRANNALAQVPSYPENVDEPRIVTSSVSDNPFLYFRTTPLPGNPQGVKMYQMRDFMEDEIRTRIERVPGVSEVRIWGGAERQIKIYIDPVKLAERELRIIDVRDAIRARNRDVSGGDLDSGKRRYLLRTVGRFTSVEEMEDMVIGRRGDALIRLRDVGYAELSTFEIRSYSYANGRPSIALGVRRQIGANVVEIMDSVVEEVEHLNRGVLKQRGLVMTLNSDDVRYVRDSISNVRRSLIIGAILATLVLFLFLRSVSATLTGALGIPICTIAAFLGLLVSGRTINVISLAGIAFAIGMTLDNSIVVLENIYRHLSEGKSRFAAALEGVGEVWPAVLASTLTTIFVFLPVIFVREEAGQLYSDIAIAISAAILMSMLVAVTVIPAACSRFLSPAPDNPDSTLNRAGECFSRWVMTFVEWMISSLSRQLVLILGLLLLVVGIMKFLTPQAEYLPDGEEPKVFSFIFAPPGYNINEMHTIQQSLNDYFLPFVGDDPGEFSRGEREIPALNYAMGYSSAGRVMMLLEASDRGDAETLKQLVTAKIQEFPGVIAFASRGSIFSSNTGGSRSINLELSGSDLVSLFDAGFRAFDRSKEIFDNPQVRPEPSTLSLGQPMLEIRPDWERAAELAIDTEDLGYTIWAYSDGAYVDEFFLGDDKIDMFLYSTRGAIEQPQDLDRIMLYSREGGIIPLSSVATVHETVNTEVIRRVDGTRTITLGIIPPREVALETGVEIVRKELIEKMRASGEIADHIHMQITGASDDLQATRQSLKGNFFVAVLISYLLMVAIFSHWGYPLLIITSVPVGIAGSIFGLWLLNSAGAHLDLLGFAQVHQPFDVITMLGFLILIGTVVNNPILLVDRTVRNIRDRRMSINTAVLESTRARLRPIMMSSITTVCGLSPLVFSPGAGTELYRGLGAIVLFGLLFSTLVTLTFIPAVLSLVLGLRERMTGATALPAKKQT